MTNENYYTVVEIDGVDVTGYIKQFEANDSTEKLVDEATFVCYPDIVNVVGVTLDPGSEVTIQRGTNSSNTIYIFRGFIKSLMPDTATLTFVAANKLWALKKREVSKSFDKSADAEAGKISAIIQTLVTTYGGLNADSGSITDSGTTLTLNKFLCRNDEVLERVMTLVEIMNWQLYYNPQDDKVYFEPLGTRSYYKTLEFTGTVSDFSTTPVVEKDFSQLYNKIVLNGAKQLDTRVDSFTASASQTKFTLTYTPQTTEVTVDTVLQERGVRGSIGDYDYHVEEDLKIVEFQTGLSGGEAVVITYSAMVPVPVVIDDPTSIEAYCPTNPTTGEKTPFQLTVTTTDVIDVADAEERVRELLEHHSTPIISYQASISHNERVMFPGYNVTINDEINAYSGTLVCRKIVRRYPNIYDTFFLADKRVLKPDNLETIQERIKKLEQETLRNVSVIHILKNFSRNIKTKRRYFKLQKRDTSADFIWGRDDWASDNWNGSYSSSPTTERIIQGHGFYRELLYDDDFIDTSASTATLDTTNRRIHS